VDQHAAEAYVQIPGTRISLGFVHSERIEAEHQFPPYDSLYFTPGTSEAIVQ